MYKLFSLYLALFLITSTTFAIGRIFDQSGEITDSAQFHAKLIFIDGHQATYQNVQFRPKSDKSIWLFSLPQNQLPSLVNASQSLTLPHYTESPITTDFISGLRTVFRGCYYTMSEAFRVHLTFNPANTQLLNLSTLPPADIQTINTHYPINLSEEIRWTSSDHFLWGLIMEEFPDSPLNVIQSPTIKILAKASTPTLYTAPASPQPKQLISEIYCNELLVPTKPLRPADFTSKPQLLAHLTGHNLDQAITPKLSRLQFDRLFHLSTIFPDLCQHTTDGLFYTQTPRLLAPQHNAPLVFSTEPFDQLNFFESLDDANKNNQYTLFDQYHFQKALPYSFCPIPEIPAFNTNPFYLTTSTESVNQTLHQALGVLLSAAPQGAQTIVGHDQQNPVTLETVTQKIAEVVNTGQRDDSFETWFIQVFSPPYESADEENAWSESTGSWRRSDWSNWWVEAPNFGDDPFRNFLSDSQIGDQLKTLYLRHLPEPPCLPFPLEQTLQQISDSENFIETPLLLTSPTQIGGGGYHPLDIHNNYHLPLHLRLLYASRHLTDALLFYGAKEDQCFDKAFIDALNRQPQVTLTYIDQWLNSDRQEIHTNALHLIFYLSLTAPSNQALFEKAFRNSQILHTHLQQLDPDNDKQSELKIILALRYGTLNTAFLTDFLSLHRITHDEIYHFEPEEVDPELQSFLRKYCKAPTNQPLTAYTNDHNSTPYFKQFYIYRRNLTTYLAIASKLRLPAARTYLKTQLRNNTPNTSTLSGRSSLTPDETPYLYPYIYDNSVLAYASFFLDDPEIADFFLKDQFIPYLLTLRQVTGPVVKAWCDTQFIKTGQPKYQLWAQLCQTTPVMSADEHLAIYQKIVELIHDPAVNTQQIRDAFFDHPLIAIDSAFWEVILKNRQNGKPLHTEPDYWKKPASNQSRFKINHKIGCYFLDHFSPRRNDPTTRSTPSTH